MCHGENFVAAMVGGGSYIWYGSLQRWTGDNIDGSSGSDAASFTCTVCGKQIIGRNRRQRLQYHLLTHTGEKTHICPYCPYKALLKFTLDRHVRSVHRQQLQTTYELSESSVASMAPIDYHLDSLGRAQSVSIIGNVNNARALHFTTTDNQLVSSSNHGILERASYGAGGMSQARSNVSNIENESQVSVSPQSLSKTDT